MNTEIDHALLAREIAMRMAPDSLLDSEDVGAMLKCDARYVRETYIKAPGFPKPVRLTGPNGQRSQPRWKRQDMVDWINSHTEGRSKLGGRPRKQALF